MFFGHDFMTFNKLILSFMKGSLILCVTLLCSGFTMASKPLSADAISLIREELEERRVHFFAQHSEKPLIRAAIKKDWNGRGDYTRSYGQSIVLFAMRACVLNEQIDEANAALQELCQYHLDRPQTFLEIHSFPSFTRSLAALYLYYGPRGSKAPNRLSAETIAIMEQTMWEWADKKSKIEQAEYKKSQTWWLQNSENHHANHFITCWAFSDILRYSADYKNKRFRDRKLPQKHYEAWTGYLKEYIRQRSRKGFLIEIDSPSYANAVLSCFFQIYDFSADSELKSLAAKFLTLYWALWAEQQIDGVTGGAQTRAYPRSVLNGNPTLRRGAWYLIGPGEPNFVHNQMLPFVTTTWKVPDIIFQIAASVSVHQPYEICQRRIGLLDAHSNERRFYRMNANEGGLLRYTYCTPDFIMGSMMFEARPYHEWAAISSQNRWSGVIFDGQRDARVFPTPYCPNGGSIYNGFWSVQSKGAMIAQQLDKPFSKRVHDWRVFFSAAGLSQPVNDGSWTFAEANSAYVGVWVLEGEFSFEQIPQGQWLVCENKLTPVIIEVARKVDYPDFGAFRTAAMAQVSQTNRGIVVYQSLSGDELRFDSRQRRLPSVNSLPVNLVPQAVFTSPFIQSDWDSGVVTIQCAEEKRLLNFNEL